jgi:hypothetical protein
VNPRAPLLALVLLSLCASVARAQCPNGAPPPCPTATPAPALNDRTWLILPFENTGRNADAEMIKPAGLNLLYQELSQWSDVRVVSDDRVDDLLRSLPDAQRSPIGLEAARTLARRVGAARVVLGDYLAVGPQAQIAAKVYDTRTGAQIRLVRERLVGYNGAGALDSMSATYSRLGAAIMGLPPRQGRVSIAGTTSIDALREYLQGWSATNRLEFATARRHLLRAIALDSTYAMAAFLLTAVAPDSASMVMADAILTRHASRLPPLEQARMAVVQVGESPAAASCAPAARLLALDSLDSWGWAGLARCELRVNDLRPYPGDPNRRLRAGSAHRARVALRRALELDPGALVPHIQVSQVLLNTTQVPVCERQGGGACPLDSLWAGAVVVQGDSVIMPLERWSVARGDPPWLRPAAVQFRRSQALAVRRIMDTWGAQAPTTARAPRNVLAQTYLAQARGELGDMAIAAAMVDSIPRAEEGVRLLGPNTRIGFKLALERPHAELARLVDSIHMETPTAQGQGHGMLGKFSLDAARNTPAATRPLQAQWLPIFAGVLPANFDSVETALVAATQSAITRANILEQSTLLAFHMRRTGPLLDTAAVHPIRRFQAWFARGDTARARAALARYDTTLARRAPGTRDDGGWMFAAESYVELGDTTRALAIMRDWGRRWRTSMKYLTGERILDTNYLPSMARIWGRSWLLLADLAAAKGEGDEARRSYQMVVSLWENGEAPVQPLVIRARSALAR